MRTSTPGPFLGLSDSELRAISPNAVTRSYPKNALVVSAGDAGDGLYIILSGRVKVFVANENGKELVLNNEGPGEFFGEMVLDDGLRSASVMTIEASKLLIIPKDDIKEFLLHHPEFAMHLILKLIALVRRLTDSVRDLALQDVYGRLTRLLYEMAEEKDGRWIIAERPTQQAMASRIGSSREMVSRIMKDLAEGKYLSLEGRKLVIHRKLPLEW